MHVSDLFREEQAVSPVIGVILMVAITVILATVIGVFAVGIGETAQTNVPEVDFDFSYDQSASPTGVTVSHERGQNIDAENLEIQGATDPSGTGWSSSDVSASDSWTGEVDTGADEIVVVWRDDDGRTSHVIGRSTVPS